MKKPLPLHEITLVTKILLQGGIILYPTDTIWGIGCDATNDTAIHQILNIKNRPFEKGLIVLVDSKNMLMKYVSSIPSSVFPLLENPKTPTTIIYPEVSGLPANLFSADGSLAIRLTRDGFCQHLIRKLGNPLVSTSANFSGKPPPSTYRDIQPQMSKEVDYVVHWRQEDNTPSKPSKVVKILPGGEVKVMRK